MDSFIRYRHDCRHPLAARLGDLRDVLQHHFKILAAHAGKSCTLALVQTHINGHLTCDKTLQCNNMRRLFYRHIIRSSYLLFLSPSRQILVPVNLFSRHNPKQSSNVPLPPVWSYPEIYIAPTAFSDHSRSGTCRMLPI